MNITENHALPSLPAKRYFSVAEVCELCEIPPHVLRYWEQEFVASNVTQRRGPRRHYQHHEVQLLRRIRHLLYEEGFTVNGVRSQLGKVSGRTPEAQTAVRVSAKELQTIRHDLMQVKAALDQALAY